MDGATDRTPRSSFEPASRLKKKRNSQSTRHSAYNHLHDQTSCSPSAAATRDISEQAASGAENTHVPSPLFVTSYLAPWVRLIQEPVDTGDNVDTNPDLPTYLPSTWQDRTDHGGKYGFSAASFTVLAAMYTSTRARTAQSHQVQN